MVGIKETSEALAGINEVAILMATQFKDGVQFQDFQTFYEAFMMNVDFKAKMQAAYENYQAIPSELKDIDLSEGMQLAAVQLGYLPRLVEAFKK